MKIATACSIAVLLMCSVAVAWGRKPPVELAAGGDSATLPRGNHADALKDSFPDAVSYPATLFVEASEAESRMLSAWLGDKQHFRRRIWVGQRHPFLDSVLPGVRALLVEEEKQNPIEMDGGSGNRILLERGRRFYSERNLNQLIYDAGLRSDSSSMATIAKVAVLFDFLGQYPAESFSTQTAPPTTGSGPPAFPPVAFLSMTWQSIRLTGLDFSYPGMRVVCSVAGRVESLAILLDRTSLGLQPRELRGIRQPGRVLYEPAKPPSPDGRRRSDARSLDVDRTVCVDGCIWELRGIVSNRHRGPASSTMKCNTWEAAHSTSKCSETAQVRWALLLSRDPERGCRGARWFQRPSRVRHRRLTGRPLIRAPARVRG